MAKRAIEDKFESLVYSSLQKILPLTFLLEVYNAYNKQILYRDTNLIHSNRICKFLKKILVSHPATKSSAEFLCLITVLRFRFMNCEGKENSAVFQQCYKIRFSKTFIFLLQTVIRSIVIFHTTGENKLLTFELTLMKGFCLKRGYLDIAYFCRVLPSNPLHQRKEPTFMASSGI